MTLQIFFHDLSKKLRIDGFLGYIRSCMEDLKFISVILPLKLEWEPCYSVRGGDRGIAGSIAAAHGTDGTGITEEIAVGDRIEVNFAGRRYVGVVSGVGVEPAAEISRIKAAGPKIAGLERVLPEEIALWKMVAEYYMCTVGEVYKAAYPAGKTNLEEASAAARQRERMRREKEAERIRARLERILQSIGKKDAMIERAKKDSVRERYILDKEKAVMSAEALRNKLRSLTAGDSVYYSGEAAEMAGRKEVNPDMTTEVTGWRDAGPHMDTEVTGGRNTGPDSGGIHLTPIQEKAAEGIREGFARHKPVLLHGVTGSGKTEIYLKLASEVLAKGKNVLYLVPEIALSRQLEDRLRVHFPEELLVFHSGETAVQKRNTAGIIRASAGSRQASGSYILLGTRSSLFLPHHDLGLIIVDEEHDSSYKQDSPAPRYNGRDTALMLARIQSCDVLLGSATPSLEELYNCLSGRHEIVRLPDRYHGADNADIEIIDTKAERRKRGMVGSISKKLIWDIQDVLARGGQVIVLRARRAWASSLQCTSCGEIRKCPHCNVSLSLHTDGVKEGIGRKEGCKPYADMGPDSGRSSGRMQCHYCGWSAPYTGKCSKCGGELVPIGAGTQRIEEEIAELFPQAKVARLDSDTAQDRNAGTQIIKDFSEGRTDILVGTQIVTKGFDFSNLQLVAVIAADSLLGMQDFRADEKAMQILEQFRGRCGRRDVKGKFVIQTSQPEHPVYQRIMKNDTDSFTNSLLMERQEFCFPPFTRIVEIQFKDRFEDRASRMASQLAGALRSGLSGIYGNDLSTVTGPYTPIPDKIADNHLRMIRISLRKDRNLKKGKDILKECVTEFEEKMKYDGHITFNVDPS